MKLKITRRAVVIGWIVFGILLVFLNCWMFSDNSKIFNDVIHVNGGDLSFGWVHIALNFLLVFADIFWIICLIWELGNDSGERCFEWLYNKDDYRSHSNDEEKEPFKFNWKRAIWLVVLLFLFIQIFKFGHVIYKQSVFLYNTSKKYHNTYQQRVEEKLGFYDKLWKTYQTKAQIANMNKDVFLKVTNVIMNNVADGQNLSWKWVSRYPDIDYNQFSAFYADLSSYIEKEREGYFSIEKVCQTISQQNNTMLDTFPNNIYNRYLKLDRIKFQYGFLSDSTNHVFARGVENLK
jgi:hypothetical protein